MGGRPPIRPPRPPRPPEPPRMPSPPPPGGKKPRPPGSGIPVPQPRPTEPIPDAPKPDAPTPSTTGNIPAAKVVAEFGKTAIDTTRNVTKKLPDQVTQEAQTQEAEQVNQDTTEAIESTTTGKPTRKRRGRRNLIGSTPFGSSGGSLL